MNNSENVDRAQFCCSKYNPDCLFEMPTGRSGTALGKSLPALEKYNKAWDSQRWRGLFMPNGGRINDF
jgi:hypothetical protein